MVEDIAGPFDEPTKKVVTSFENVGSKVLYSCRVESMVHEFPL